MRKNESIGITLLFAEKIDEQITGMLNSYVISANSWQDLKKNSLILITKEIFSKDRIIVFVNISDVFYVSGKVKPFSLLGKTYYDELNKMSSATELILNNVEIHTKGLYLCELIFFYKDDVNKDYSTILCFSLLRITDKDSFSEEISKSVNNNKFKSQILTAKLDRLDYQNLVYVGIKSMSYYGKKFFYNSPFQTLSRDFKNWEEVFSCVENPKQIRKKVNFILSRR